MTDVLTPDQRRLNMSRIRGMDTQPEMVVRRFVHSLGFRYRLHDKALPGRPDIVLPRHHKVILVNGCFWHMHNCPLGLVVPKTNEQFWRLKREGNVKRDKRNIDALEELGWKIFEVWECQLRDPESILEKVSQFLVGD